MALRVQQKLGYINLMCEISVKDPLGLNSNQTHGERKS